MDSRRTDFGEQVRQATGGHGVDLVLNSLTGEAIPGSLALVAPGGRFLELGKIGVWDPESVARSFPDVEYHQVAVDEVVRLQPELIGDILRRIVAAVAAGELAPLPLRIFPLNRAVSAFRTMQQARHSGKIVLTHPLPPVRADGTYLITGGLGGRGVAVARPPGGSGGRRIRLVWRGGP